MISSIERLIRCLIRYGQKFGVFRTIQELLVDSAMEQTLSVQHKAEQLVFSTPNKLARYRAITFSDKEPETLEWIDGFNPDSVLWDIGANVGLYSIYAAKKGIKVMAFEPSIFNLELLGRNIHLNRVENNIVILPFPLNDQTAVNLMHMGSTQRGSALSSFGRDIGFDGKPFQAELICQSLGISCDDVVEFFGLPLPTYIKLDVDGNEHLILKGARNILRAVESVLVEVNDGYDEQATMVSELLKQSGFELLTKRHGAMVEESELFATTFNQIWKKAV